MSPCYRHGMTIDTAPHRRAALHGWVYSPYRMNDLMQGILKGWDLEAKKLIRLQMSAVTGQMPELEAQFNLLIQVMTKEL